MNNVAARPFGRHTLNSAGSNYLSEYILPEVRARLDEEPVGDADSSFDPGTVEPNMPADDPQPEAGEETQNEEVAQSRSEPNEDTNPSGIRLDTLKYSWATKAFGDAVKASPTNNGVIVLYADENYYDVSRLMGFIEDGRNRVAEASALGGERIQVLFGGYRAVPQVELWVVPDGAAMPEFKPDDRSKPAESAN